VRPTRSADSNIHVILRKGTGQRGLGRSEKYGRDRCESYIKLESTETVSGKQFQWTV
jgi:hypothetical protein